MKINLCEAIIWIRFDSHRYAVSGMHNHEKPRKLCRWYTFDMAFFPFSLDFCSIVLWRKLSNDLFKCNCNSNFICSFRPKSSGGGSGSSGGGIQSLSTCFLTVSSIWIKHSFAKNDAFNEIHANVSSKCTFSEANERVRDFEWKLCHILWTYLHRNWCISLEAARRARKLFVARR